MTEARKPMAKKRVMSVTSPEEKAKAFVEAMRKRESEDVKHKISPASECAHHKSQEKEIARIGSVNIELRRKLDEMNRELNKQQVIYNTNFSEIQEALKNTWSYKIRSFFGF